MLINGYTKAPDPYFSNVKEAFSKVGHSDSIDSKIKSLAIALILLPFLTIKDSLDLMIRPFRKVKPLTFKEKLAVIFDRATSEKRKVVKATKEFLKENKSHISKSEAVVLVSIGVLYLSKFINENSDLFWKNQVKPDINDIQKSNSLGLWLIAIPVTLVALGLVYIATVKQPVNLDKGRIEGNVNRGMLQADRSYSLQAVKNSHSRLDENKFVGLVELKKIHKAQLEEFRKDINAIIDLHFDWWTFPIKSTSFGHKSKYAIDNATIEQLVADEEFMNNYLESTQLVLAAYGWELKNKDDGYVIEPLAGTVQRAIVEVRVAKMAESFHLFNHKLYKALVELNKAHPNLILVKHSRTRAAFNLDSWASPNAWVQFLRSFN